MRALAENPNLAGIQETANQHLGASSEEIAAQYGLEPARYMRLWTYYGRLLTQLRDGYASGLPQDESGAVDAQIAASFRLPAFAKWYDDYLPVAPRGGSYDRFYDRVEDIRTTL